jgi:hypothetical protein
MSELEESVASTSRPGSPVPPLPDFNAARPYRFTWDASTRRPGPGSVSGTSEGRGGDYISYKPSLGHFNFSTSSLTLGAIASDWSSSKYGFNGAPSYALYSDCGLMITHVIHSYFERCQQSTQTPRTSQSPCPSPPSPSCRTPSSAQEGL